MFQLANRIAAALLLALAMAGCKSADIKDARAYMKYLADPDNGLIKEKSVAGVKFKLKYLPGDYLAYTTLKNRSADARIKDSTIKSFDHSVTFLLNIGPSDDEDFDITRVGVNNYQEFAERIENMSFHAQEWISVREDGKDVAPVIVRMENINALEKSRNFIVVFSSEKNTGRDLRNKDLCFVYEDEMFNTGTSKFMFKAKDLERIPEFKF